MRIAKYIAVLCVMLVSCRTVQPSIDHSEQRGDTVRVLQRDSIYLRVSDTVKIYTKGDTVFHDVVRWRDRYSLQVQHDTVVKVERISTNEVKVVAKMNRFQTTFFWIGIVLVVLLVLYILYRIRKMIVL